MLFIILIGIIANVAPYWESITMLTEIIAVFGAIIGGIAYLLFRLDKASFA